MEQYIPLIVSALGGIILGPLVTKLLGGSTTAGILGGILGGVGAHYGADAAGIGPLFGSDPALMHLQNFLEGAAGGGLLGLMAGAVLKKR
ncbi:MAG: hypothetical protein ACK4MQ_06855 [Hyphomonas sp.]